MSRDEDKFSPSLKPSEVPHDIQRLTRNRYATYAGASEYYAKFADLASHRVGTWMLEKAPRSYALREPFARYFQVMMRHKVAQHLSDTQPRCPKSAADFVALALYCAAGNFRRYDKAEAELLKRGEVWPKTRPIGDAWSEMGDVGANLGSGRGIYEWDGKLLRLPITPFDHPRVSINEIFQPDTSNLPKLTFEFEGAPIALLYRARYDLKNLEERELLRRKANKLIAELLTQALKSLQLKKAKANRPKQHELGSESAWLHYGEGMSWSKVAKRLCTSKHIHDVNCSTRMRLAASRWYGENSPKRIPIVEK